MPWEITLVNYEGNPALSYRAPDRPEPLPLGSKQSVVERISSCVPELEWYEEPPMTEMIQRFPDHPFRELLASWPEEMRARASRPKLRAIYDQGDLSMELYGFDEDPLKFLCIEVRGNDDPLPLLRRLCVPNGWSVVDDADGSFLDLSTDRAGGWERFRNWRDTAIGHQAQKKSFDIDPGGQSR
jgi:hypothetical protein